MQLQQTTDSKGTTSHNVIIWLQSNCNLNNIGSGLQFSPLRSKDTHALSSIIYITLKKVMHE